MCDEKVSGGMDEVKANESCCSQLLDRCASSGKPIRLVIRAEECCDTETANAETGACCGSGEEAADRASGCCIEVRCTGC